MEEENRLRKIRIEKGYSVSDLAKAIGKDQSSLSRYEAGQIPLDVVTKLSSILNVSPAYLMGWSNSITLDVASIPVIDSVVEGKLTSTKTIDIPLSTIQDRKLTYYEVEDAAMSPYVINNALVLVKEKTEGKDGSLVVILPDNEIDAKPMVRIVKYDEDTILFVATDRKSKIYTVDTATVLGDVVTITHDYTFK